MIYDDGTPGGHPTAAQLLALKRPCWSHDHGWCRAFGKVETTALLGSWQGPTLERRVRVAVQWQGGTFKLEREGILCMQ